METSLQRHDRGEPIDVLLVEDSPGDARLTQVAFEETDRLTTFEVIDDGDEAVSALTRHATDDSLPDLVLLDLNLPGRGGHDVLEAIRDDQRLENLPVIILTGSAAEEDIVRCYEASANAYLTKPDSPDEYIEMAKTVQGFWIEQARLPPVPA